VVPEYPSARDLITDATLRIDAWRRESLGVIVVEGPDDKKLFYRRVHNPAQIIVAGGRKLLLAAYEAAKHQDLNRIIFVTDCDYAVRRGELSGGHGLAITTNTNVEADLVELNLLLPVILEISPRTMRESHVTRLCEEILFMAQSIAIPLGQIRMATEPLGVSLKLDELDLSKFWNRRNRTPDTEKMLTVIGQKLKRGGIEGMAWRTAVNEVPADPSICNGKDLLRATRMILHHHYGVSNEITDTVFIRMVRLAMDSSSFESWGIVKRIRVGEERTGGVALLAKPGRTGDPG
jgi:hypothetical protein